MIEYPFHILQPCYILSIKSCMEHSYNSLPLIGNIVQSLQKASMVIIRCISQPYLTSLMLEPNVQKASMVFIRSSSQPYLTSCMLEPNMQKASMVFIRCISQPYLTSLMLEPYVQKASMVIMRCISQPYLTSLMLEHNVQVLLQNLSICHIIYDFMKVCTVGFKETFSRPRVYKT